MPELDLSRTGNLGQMASFRIQMRWLLYRNRALMREEPRAMRTKIANCVVTAIFMVILYWHVGGTSPTDLQNFACSVFFWQVSLFTANMFNTILIFQTERANFLRENANQMYSVTSYFLSKQLMVFASSVYLPLVQLMLIYWTLGYRVDNWIPEFFQIWLLEFLLVQCGIGFGFFISALVPKYESATAAAPLLTMPAVLFGGMFLNSNSYPVWIGWMKYLSPIYFANCGVLLAQWQTAEEIQYQYALAFFVGSELSYT